MTKFVGRLGTLGIGIETVRGTAVAPTHWVPQATMSFADKANIEREEQGMGNVADSDSIFVTMRTGEGELESQLYDKALGVILTSIIGELPTTGGSNPYTHTFSFSNTNQQPSLSLYWQDPNFSLMFPLAVVEQVEVTIEPSGIINWTIAFKSRASKDWARLTPDFTSLGNKFLHQHAKFRLAANIGALSGATPISVKQLEMTISRNSVFDDVIGTVEPEDVLGQQVSVEGTLTLNLEDATYKDYMLNGSYRALELFLNRSTSSSLKLQFPRVDFNEWEPDYTLNEIAKQEVSFKANYDAANALDIISLVELINAEATY